MTNKHSFSDRRWFKGRRAS